MFTRIALLSSLLFVSPAWSQDRRGEVEYGQVAFHPGPAVLRAGHKWAAGLSEVRHAALPLGEVAASIFILSGKNAAGLPDYRLIVERLDSSVTMSSLGFAPSGAEDLAAEKNVRFQSTGSLQTPLELRILPGTGTLRYRWPLSASTSQAPGGLPTLGTALTLIREGQKLPDLELVTLDGEAVSRGSLHGKWVVLNYWSTACAPCVEEMPGLNILVESLRARDDVRFIAVAATAYDDAEDIRELLATKPFNYLQTLYSGDPAPMFGPSWPRHVIIDPAGIVIYDASGGGGHTYKELDAVLAERLKQQ